MEGRDQEVETWTVVVDADTRALQREMRAAASVGRQFSRSLVGAFEGVAIKGRSLGDVFRGLALDLSKIVLRQAFKPLEQGFGSLINGLLSGGFGGGKAGAASSSALPLPFAKGGVVQSPVGFPLGRGSFGIAGERGAEAIMPLARSSDGRLGVVSQGGGGVSVTLNVTTPDADSFARSESQVAAMLARAVSLGQRNL